MIKVLLFLLFACLLFGKEPTVLYLTWLEDPTTTMTIQWQTEKEEIASSLAYQRLDEEEWHQAEGTAELLSDSTVLMHRVDLKGLVADGEYRFHIGKEKTIYRFKTMPAEDDRPVRFVVGGDAYYYLFLFRKINQQIAKTDPDFIVVGGDIAYTYNNRAFFKGPQWEVRRWQTFLREWQETMVDSEGRLIPILPVVGNHDLRKAKHGGEREVPLFYQVFAMPERLKAYRALDFGNYLSLLLLDTGHSSPIEGPQTSWLQQILEKRRRVNTLMAVYHMAAYPSVYGYKDLVPTRIRNFWVPLFEKYGLDTAFENHNHAYKRTYRIKGEQRDPTGVQYLGDGSWGVVPRAVKNGKSWYIAAAERANCFWVVTLHQGKREYESRAINGKVIEKLNESAFP